MRQNGQTQVQLSRNPTPLGASLALTLSLSLTALCATPGAHAQSVPERVPTEAEVLSRWMNGSPEVASWRTEIGAARFDVVTASLWPNPQLSVSFSATPTGTPPDGEVNVGAQLGMSLPIFGQLTARRSAATAALRVAEVTVAERLWVRASELEAAMVERAFADARIVNLETGLSEVARIEDIIRRRVAQGASSPYDSLRVGATVSTLRAARAAALVERERAEARLLALVADPTLRALPVTRASLSPPEGTGTLEGSTSLALQRRPDLELARRGVRAAEATATRYRREALPVPAFSVGVYMTQGEDSVTAQAGLNLPLPIFDRNQGLVGRAVTEAQGQRALVTALESRVRTEVAGAWRARAHAREALDEFRREGRPGASELLHRAEVSYETGGLNNHDFTVVDLLDAYRALWEARNQELELERSMYDSEVDLERATATFPH